MPRNSLISPRGTSGAVVAIPKPGTSVQWNVFETPSMTRIEGLPGNARSPKFSRADLVSGRRQVFRQFGGTYNVQIKLIGWRTLIQHHVAASSLIVNLATQVTQLAGEMVRDSALTDSTFKNVTGDTRRSMLNDPVMSRSGTDIIASMGPTTFYSAFLEFGWVKGGNTYAFPFMIPALNKHKIDFINGLIDVAGIVAGNRPYALRGAMGQDSRITSNITKARSFLYSKSKALGDVAVLTGSRFIGPVRGAMLFMAKELGDASAIMNHSVGSRISNRLSGAVTGRALGLTRTISASTSFSGFPGGGNTSAVGSRVYNRVAGRATSRFATGGIG